MEILRAILVAVEAIVCLLTIVVVMVQKSKSEGMGLAFGAGVGETLFGSRAGNVLSKATVVLGAIFLINTLALALVFAGFHERSLMERVTGPRAPAAAPAQRGGASQPLPASSGIPTLPGGAFDDEAAAAAETPSEALPTDAPAPTLPAADDEGEPAEEDL